MSPVQTFSRWWTLTICYVIRIVILFEFTEICFEGLNQKSKDIHWTCKSQSKAC